jgi:hypothetical protein
LSIALTAGDNSTVIGMNIFLSGKVRRHSSNAKLCPGYLDMKINYSSRVADDAIYYAAFVEVVDVRIRNISDQIRVTTSVMGSLKRLFEEFTNDGADMGGQRFFKVDDLREDIQACSHLFNRINHSIYDVVSDLPSKAMTETRKSQKLKIKAEKYLKERMRSAEGAIHVYQWRLMIQVQTFSIRLSNR